MSENKQRKYTPMFGAMDCGITLANKVLSNLQHS
jgi:hypothetical protein